MVLRIEDTDASRDHAPHIDQIIEDLRWLGINWLEGVGAGGDSGPYRQSERAGIYAQYYEKLEKASHVYACFCSPSTLKLARKTQLAAGQPPRYPGTCASLEPAEVKRRLNNGEAATLRFRVPDDRVIRFNDLVRGKQEFRGEDIGDFIIRRADGTPAFFFSNAVDDALMGVTHALRGEDHLANTPRQLLILETLDLNAPVYGHFPMVIGANGKPLSKRKGSNSIQSFKVSRYLPLALVNYLARLGHHYEAEGFKSWQQLAEEFDVKHLGRAPAHFDVVQLDHWQKEAVQALSLAEFEQWLGETILADVPKEARAEFCRVIKPNTLIPSDAAVWVAILYEHRAAEMPGVSILSNEHIEEAGKQFFSVAADAVKKYGVDYKKVTEEISKETGAKGKALFKPLRLALTGCDQGPELAGLLTLMGKAVAEARLRHLSG